MAAAQRLLAANPPTPAQRDYAVKYMVENAADRALAFARITTRTVDRWAALRERLSAYYADHIRPHRAAVDAQVTDCLTQRYAGQTPADIDAATAFFSTPAGRAMWPVISDANALYPCTSAAVRDDLIDFAGGMRSAGLKPPPEPDRRLIMY